MHKCGQLGSCPFETFIDCAGFAKQVASLPAARVCAWSGSHRISGWAYTASSMLHLHVFVIPLVLSLMLAFVNDRRKCQCFDHRRCACLSVSGGFVLLARFCERGSSLYLLNFITNKALQRLIRMFAAPTRAQHAWYWPRFGWCWHSPQKKGGHLSHSTGIYQSKTWSQWAVHTWVQYIFIMLFLWSHSLDCTVLCLFDSYDFLNLMNISAIAAWYGCQ